MLNRIVLTRRKPIVSTESRNRRVLIGPRPLMKRNQYGGPLSLSLAVTLGLTWMNFIHRSV
jgi:hypothetical protein